MGEISGQPDQKMAGLLNRASKIETAILWRKREGNENV